MRSSGAHMTSLYWLIRRSREVSVWDGDFALIGNVLIWASRRCLWRRLLRCVLVVAWRKGVASAQRSSFTSEEVGF